ncbi:hypothetical protein DYI37_04700 [Fulvimarina endophytica]|uniref:Crescentin coiled-coil domain-containing protein n=1 Tax=Fulvimarina endophytica TaxID=2293836 RepID=A0A371X7V2_9HYPH|nr:hypothetical protein [Fulvimarina endophytica]RFC65154.1 hypothetical protein DYI37_04700 [Fulvimarina endophytica]
MTISWRTFFSHKAGLTADSGKEARPQPAGRGPEGQAVAEDAPQAAPAAKKNSYAPLENLGERNELLHVRFGYMADRLEDLKSLAEDFNLLAAPIAEMATELPQAKSRLIEYQALLERESEENRSARDELKGLRRRLSLLEDEKLRTAKRIAALEAAVEKAEEDAAELRIREDELESLRRNAEKRADLEHENRQAVEAELSHLSSKASAYAEDLQAAIADRDTAKERSARLEAELGRLQKIVDQQVLQLVEHEARAGELEKASRQQLAAIEDLEGRLVAQRTEHEAALHQAGLQNSSLAAEKASMTLKVEELNARTAAMDQTIGQLRTAQGDRDNMIQKYEAALRDAEKGMRMRDRENAVLEQQLKDRTQQFNEIKQASDEAAKRAAMLNKALSGKSAALDSALEQVEARADQMDELTQRFEKEKAALKAANRRLLEDLEAEKAERTLAQGALKIARESRSWLQKQNEALKRSNRALRTATDDADLPVEFSDERPPEEDFEDEIPRDEPTNNVSHFRSRTRDPNDKP